MAGTSEEKQESVDDAMTSAIEAGEVDMPYSIYSNKEKWMIVGMVALAGFYRYVFILNVLTKACRNSYRYQTHYRGHDVDAMTEPGYYQCIVYSWFRDQQCFEYIQAATRPDLGIRIIVEPDVIE
jgi:hypothetical protein